MMRLSEGRILLCAQVKNGNSVLIQKVYFRFRIGADKGYF